MDRKDFAALLGALLVISGLAQIYVPLAFIVSGLGLLYAVKNG